MYKKLIYKSILIIFFIFSAGIFWSCANMAAPTGGPKDETPPVVLNSIPANESAGFSGSRFDVFFDEYVEIQNLEENFISSPPFETRPEMTISGKRLRVAFLDTLIPNTTYRIQFGNAIVDVNERNPLPDFEYVFSTGQFIDSMMIQGRLQNAFTLLPENKASIILYENFYDSIVAKQRPLYITKTKEDGSFVFKNLKNTSYKILALKDLNANLLYDLPTEEIGFLDELVEPFSRSDLDSIPLDSFPSNTINLFIPDDTTQRVLFSDYIANGTIKIVTKLPIENLQMDVIPKEICYEQNVSKDTIMVWLPPSEKDSIFLILKDSERIIDTVREKYYEESIDKRKLPKFLESNITSTFPYYEQFTLTFSSPVLSFDSESAIALISPRDTIVQIIDSVSSDSTDIIETEIELELEVPDSIQVEKQDIFDTITVFDTIPVSYYLKNEGCSRTVIIDIEPVQGEEYSFFIFGNEFTSIYGDTNETTNLKTKVSKEEDYGTFNFDFQGTENSQYIIQLLTANEDRIIQENILIGSDSINYIHLAPAEYKMKIIEDKNQNGKWDSGNYWETKQPETIKYFDKSISIRANWALEESFQWEITNSAPEELIPEENE